MKWTKKWPNKPGYYWAYWYRYGKISCGSPCKPEMSLMEVRRIANGIMRIADGQFVFEHEPEEAYFMEAIIPEPPVNTALTPANEKSEVK